MGDVVDINKNKPAEDSNQAVLMVFTNHKDEQHLGVARGLLKMFYHTVLHNRLAVMSAKNAETGEEELILVGVEQNGDAINAYPLALPLKAEDVAKFVAPDGQGGWVEKAAEEA